MYSISQIYKNELKNRIKNEISNFSDEMVDIIVNNLTNPSTEEKYFNFVSCIQDSTRELIKKIIVNTFEELDYQYKNSAERLKKYVVNKSNVSRTITTIFGEITFKRTYYKSRLTGENFFTLTKFLDYLNMTIMTHLLKLWPLIKLLVLLVPKQVVL